jgi:hypothetical protein
MFSLYEILGILLIHWFADFVLQTDEQAKGKSKEWKPLLQHVANYSSVWMLIGSIVFPFNQVINLIYFTLITFITHTITDYFTSRLNSKLWGENKVHNFFVSIGFDQWLHYLQLFLTYYLLIKC